MTGVRLARRADLLAAIKAGEPHIEVTAPIEGLPCLELSHGQALTGAGAASLLSFAGDGLVLHGANRLRSLHLACPAQASAISLAPGAPACGWFDLEGITCRGLIHLLFGDQAGHVDLTLRHITLLAADATARLPRPTGNGVEVLQGALTVWNQASASTRIMLDACDIRIGSAGEPVRGTGLFVAGNQSGGGSVVLRRMSSGPVFSDSTLPQGTTGTVAGGIFFLAGVTGDRVETCGDVTTWGANAVPIDNWGRLGHWRIAGDARSHGASAVGMVNAGTLERCTIAGVIETFGDGARGCCIYGPTGTITATAIRTHGKAATGLQVVDRLEALVLAGGLRTAGGPGQGLVKGLMIETPAHGVEVEPGGRLERLEAGRIEVAGALALPVHAPPGAIGMVADQR